MIKDRIFLSPPHMSGAEKTFVAQAFESNYIAPLGPMVDAFEHEFSETVGIRYTVALSSGTAAMHLAMRFLGVGKGDTVIASTLTFVGSVSPAVYQGAEPIFIDSDRQSWNMDPDLLAEELERCRKKGRLPKVVIPTDLYGQCCDMERITGICEAYGVPVVADSAEALGATYQKAEGRRQKAEGGGEEDNKQGAEGREQGNEGQRGKVKGQNKENKRKLVHAGVGARAAVYSFNGNKIITTSGGGMLASDDREIINKARFWSQQAREPFPHYEHRELGYNYRMSNILAAIGRGQLHVLEDRVQKKREIFEYYQENLGNMPGIEFMPEAPYGRCTRWLTVTLITPETFGVDREVVRLALEAENIESRPVWKPMHMQPVFKGCRVVGGSVAEDLFERGLCLPSGTQLSREEQDRVIETIRKCRK
jgi:dTDP-4-amino-4,6-dideoxygalactose transaminase